jgi:UDP-N-acetylglucosamine--N-acetylmuramyl-(pentapeptide) pyrophosphoryl-undecaprenol N-acetylglucosamine transferase
LNINFEIFNFSNNILDYFSKVNLAITRSGSSMLAELTNVKIPFISVPLPSSADNHQLKNAIYYEKKGYSYLIEEKEIKIRLFKLIKNIHLNPSLLSQITQKQRQHSDKSVYENIDKKINEILNEKH